MLCRDKNDLVTAINQEMLETSTSMFQEMEQPLRCWPILKVNKQRGHQKLRRFFKKEHVSNDEVNDTKGQDTCVR